MAGARKRFSLAETVRLLQDSDAESFEEDDIDSGINYEPSDSESTEREDEDQDEDSDDQSQTAAAASDQPQADVGTDSDTDAEAATASDASADGWHPVLPSYAVPDDITFTGQAEITAALSGDATPVDIFSTFVTDDIVQLMVTETKRMQLTQLK